MKSVDILRPATKPHGDYSWTQIGTILENDVADGFLPRRTAWPLAVAPLSRSQVCTGGKQTSCMTPWKDSEWAETQPTSPQVHSCPSTLSPTSQPRGIESVLCIVKELRLGNAQDEVKGGPSKPTCWLAEATPQLLQHVAQLTGNRLRKYPLKCRQ